MSNDTNISKDEIAFWHETREENKRLKDELDKLQVRFELAEKHMEEFKKENEEWEKGQIELHDELDKTKTKLKKALEDCTHFRNLHYALGDSYIILQEVIEFYANEETYPLIYKGVSSIELDKGKRAREVSPPPEE